MSPAPAPGIPFFKLSGAGNDFIALPEPRREPRGDEIRAWCRRGLSLGADGVFTLARRDGAVRMAYHNADGSRGGLCLNGSRCAARLAFHLGWSEDDLRLQTDVGTLRARATGSDRIALELPDIVETPEAVSLPLAGQTHEGWFLRVGVPHLVLRWPEPLSHAPVAELGSPLRHHPHLGDPGANVNFARFTAPDRCEIRTFERGVEAETLACGTGVVATAAVGLATDQLTLPATVLTAGGFELLVGRAKDTAPWTLEGDARILARGELQEGASTVPAPPRWS